MPDISAIIDSLKVGSQEIESYKTFEVIPTDKRRQVNLMKTTVVSDMTRRWTMVVGYVDESNAFDWESVKNKRITTKLLNGQVVDYYGCTYLSQTSVKRDGEADPDTEITLHFDGPPKKT